MLRSIEHRGPDSRGIWSDDQHGVLLGHRRLSILDPSDAGHQPMQSQSGRYVISYNGEIYNHFEIRSDIAAEQGPYQWRGHSDTETILAAFDYWGFEATLPKLNGMFAIAVWDKVERVLHLARDRAGEKPVYYGRSGSHICFASELKAFEQIPGWEYSIDAGSLQCYFQWGSFTGNRTIYSNIFKLPPAHHVQLRCDTPPGQPISYWQISDADSIRFEDNDQLEEKSRSEHLGTLHDLLRSSVRQCLLSDVPLGAFLSGGIDSSLVVALMQEQSASRTKTFSIGFEYAELNEATYAKRVSDILQTDHTELYITEKEALDVIPLIPGIWDEPFSDSSQIPTYLVSRLAANEVKVALSGDGGDELFFGYTRYLKAANIWRKISRNPYIFRQLASTFLNATTPACLSLLKNRRYTGTKRNRALPFRLQVLNHLYSSPDLDTLYYRLNTRHYPGDILNDAAGEAVCTRRRDDIQISNDFTRMMKFEFDYYLPDTILTKVDRASMACSLETRAPLLDYRVIEFAMQAGSGFSYFRGNQKWPLKTILGDYLPENLINRPKQGFAIPLEQWLRGPLNDWAESLLDSRNIRSVGYLNEKSVTAMWRQFKLGQFGWQHHLWSILMFLSWYEQRVK